MADAEHAHSVVQESTQDAVVADAEAKRSSEFPLERDDIAVAGTGEAENAFEDAHRRELIQGADICLGLIEPFNPLRRHYLAFSVERESLRA
jgi:hypothetical protein